MVDTAHEADILPNRSDHRPIESHMPHRDRYDVAIVGASLAGCSSAILLARAGARVALIEKSPDPDVFKRICSHYIQGSAIPTLERLGLLEPMEAAGGLRSRIRVHSPQGWIEPPMMRSKVPSGINLRRRKLDPLIRTVAAETPAVELMLGMTVDELSREGDWVSGVCARDKHGVTRRIDARLVVGADGRGSRVAKLAGVRSKTVRHGRFAYGGYFEGPLPDSAPASTLWLLDPDMAGAFPTDDGLIFYAAMPTMGRLAPFREDPAKALVEHVAKVPDAPPIRESRLLEPAQGKIDMTNIAHVPTAPGVALVGDAALAIDPLWGVGCGWAFQSAEWLADSVAPALAGREPIERGLRRYRRAHARRLRGHAQMIYDYAGGRRLNPGERMLFGASGHDERLAVIFEQFGTRSIGPARMFASAVPRAAFVTARDRVVRRRSTHTTKHA